MALLIRVIGMTNYLSTQALAQRLRMSLRGARYLLARLEHLGFALETGHYGARLIPVKLVDLIVALRAAKQPLRRLKEQPEAQVFLKASFDSHEVLIQLRVEVALLREIVGVLHKLQRERGTMARTNLSELGFPDPQVGL